MRLAGAKKVIRRVLPGRGRRSLASGSVVMLSSAALVAAAFSVEGFHNKRSEARDGSVWVVSGPKQSVGRLNTQLTRLDLSRGIASAAPDVFQYADAVLVVSTDSSTIAQVAVKAGAIGAQKAIPKESQVAMGGPHESELVAFADPTGGVFAVPLNSLSGFDPKKEVPLTQAGPGTKVAVAADGTLIIVDPTSSSLTRILAGDVEKANAFAKKLAAAKEEEAKSGSTTTAPSTTLAKGQKAVAEPEFKLVLTPEKLSSAPLGDIQVAVVGNDPVVLDTKAAQLLRPRQSPLDVTSLGKGVVLQQSGPKRDFVLLAGDASLATVGLKGTTLKPLTTQGAGQPARPVAVETCLLGAWAGTTDGPTKPNTYSSCQAPGAEVVDVPGGSKGVPLTFRVNREAWALNDDDGQVIANGQPVTNWDEVKQIDLQDDQTDQSNNDAAIEQEAKPDRSGKNEVPFAENDDIGVRPGRSTFLPVLENDRDRNGDVLTVKSFTPIPPELGTVVSINGGQSLQFTPAAGRVDGVAQFSYIATDGVEGSQSNAATVQVSIHPPIENKPPKEKKNRKPSKTTAKVGDPNGVVHDVLSDWMDPDGDVLTLKSAKVESAEDLVRFSPAGTVTFYPQSKGERGVEFAVSDGRETVPGRLQVTVTDQNVAPKARNDFATGFVGTPIVLKPLANDTDPNNDEVRLGEVTPVNPSAVVDAAAGTITVTSDTPRTIILDYAVTDTPNSGSPATSKGVARIDVLPKGAQGKPVAVLDSTVVTVGRPSLVDVLANDIDPENNVLVLESVSVQDRPDIDVSVSENRSVRVLAKTASVDSSAPFVATYRISNGRSEVDGNLVVQVVEPSDKDQPPIARKDEVTVRAGDVITVPVLANDSDPEGGPLALDPSSVKVTSTPAAGTLFASGPNIRFVAPVKKGRIAGEYSVRDESGQSAGTLIAFDVRELPVDPAKDDAPPAPKPLEARGFAGSKSIEIKVPVDGVDPDGDSVRLAGDGQGKVPPKFGRIGKAIDGRTLVYEPDRTFVGTEEFTYAVVDRWGKVGEALLRIGIVPRPDKNRVPVAVDDKVTVKPSTRLSVPVIRNDYDPDADPLTLDPTSLKLSSPTLTAAELPTDLALGDDKTVVFTAPEKATSTFVTYAITDGKGGQASGLLTVITDPNAKGLAPLPLDDDVRNTKAELNQATIDIDVRANDVDPDTAKTSLTVGFPTGQDPALAQVGDPGHAVFALGATEQVVAYTLTDPEGNVGTAVAYVPAKRDPAKENKPPVLRDGAPLEVKFGESIDIDINQVAADPEGQKLRLTSSAAVKATHAATPELVVNETTLKFTPEKDYVGNASIAFEVADGVLPADGGNGQAALLTLPITVKPKDNQPPTAKPGQIQPGQGDPATVLDLRALVDDPDPDDIPKLKISEPKGDSAGMKVSFADGVLSVEAPSGVKKGTTAKLTYTVTDGRSDPVSSTIDIVVQRSTQPLPKAIDDQFPGKLSRGKPSTISPLDNDFNPFPGKPLKILNAEVPPAQGTVSVGGGTTITFTPDAKYSGVASIRYQIEDDTADPDRRATGQISAKVIGKPDKPQAPSVVETRSNTVVLSWQPPAMNGGDFKNYLVHVFEGGGEVGAARSAGSTTATITPLPNSPHKYTFTVVAVNEDGESEPSGASSEAEPDEKLPKMSPPTLAFVPATSGRLDVAWGTPDQSNGSAPIDYKLEVAPTPAGGNGIYTIPQEARPSRRTGSRTGPPTRCGSR
jgi:large repetitive protein